MDTEILGALALVGFFIFTIVCVIGAKLNASDTRPCRGKNENVCVAEGCYNEACLERENY